MSFLNSQQFLIRHDYREYDSTWSGTHYRLSFVICGSVLVFIGALLIR